MIRSPLPRSSFAVIAGLSLVLSAAAAGAAEKMIHVQGRVVEPGGGGVAGVPVRLFKTTRSLQLGKFSSGGHVAEATRTESDANGYFEIRMPRDRAYDDYFLRYYDRETFDRVKYRLPEDREITKDLRRSSPVIVELPLRFDPRWDDVQARIGRVGADSAKGRILRSMGIPEREMAGSGPDGPRTEWWYHTRGIVYFFHDGVAAGQRRFEPIRAAREDGGV